MAAAGGAREFKSPAEPILVAPEPDGQEGRHRPRCVGCKGAAPKHRSASSGGTDPCRRAALGCNAPAIPAAPHLGPHWGRMPEAHGSHFLLRFVIIKIYHKSCGLFVHLHSGAEGLQGECFGTLYGQLQVPPWRRCTPEGGTEPRMRRAEAGDGGPRCSTSGSLQRQQGGEREKTESEEGKKKKKDKIKMEG